MIIQSFLTVPTPGRGMISITDQLNQIITSSSVTTGICQLFIQHTSASLLICENADPLVQKDLEHFMQRLTPDGDPNFLHVDEGPDDMPSHIRSVLTTSSLCIPLTNKRLALGTWQGVYLWEHRFKAHTRKVVVTLVG